MCAVPHADRYDPGCLGGNHFLQGDSDGLLRPSDYELKCLTSRVILANALKLSRDINEPWEKHQRKCIRKARQVLFGGTRLGA